MKNAVIIGPGAMGILFSYFLADTVGSLWLLDHHQERARSISQQGLKVDTEQGLKTVQVRATADPAEPGHADLVILCVKAYSTKQAIEGAMPVIGPETTVLSLQNGMGNVETLIELLGPERVLGGTTSQGANVIRPGHIRHAGMGETVMGEPQAGSGRAAAVIELFKKAGIATSGTDDLQGLIMSKVVINVGINALTALLRVHNGKLVDYEGSKKVMAAAVAEAVAVCTADNIKLLYDEPVAKVESVARATAENIASMLQDVRAERRTEVEQINGAIVRAGQRLGVPTPVNQTLSRLVSALEQSYKDRVD